MAVVQVPDKIHAECKFKLTLRIRNNLVGESLELTLKGNKVRKSGDVRLKCLLFYFMALRQEKTFLIFSIILFP